MKKSGSPTPLELLSPARDLATGIVAIDHGADAVYIGACHHGARASAGNSVEDIARLVEYAHRFRAKVYVTLNTLIYDNEVESVKKLVCELYQAGVDALIIQDMGLLEMDLPPIPLHASTQCDTRTVERAVFLAENGFDQIVLPREFTIEQIRAVHAEIPDAVLEGFVHGALCVSFSGDCRASFVSGGRSANRGECAQICRLPYDLTDKEGNVLIHDRHLLSLRDMNRLAHLGDMANAGISSFKIEGRLKSPEYVANITAAYSRVLDEIVESSEGRYIRASVGRVVSGFDPSVAKSFNRGFTNYFLTGSQPEPGSLGAHLTPKSIGEVVGKVISSTNKSIRVKTLQPLTNGDGLGYFDSNERFVGFRANRVDGDTIFLAAPLSGPVPKNGTVLYRNYDKAFSDKFSTDKPRRVIDVDMCLQPVITGVALTLTDSRGVSVSSVLEGDFEAARSPQGQQHQRVLDRIGDTIYHCRSITDEAEGLFIPASQLTELRRRAIEMLDHAASATRPIEFRQVQPVTAAKADIKPQNVANRFARLFYERRGLPNQEQAIEVSKKDLKNERVRVMTTRYCLRRELGACLKTSGAKKLPGGLVLRPVGSNARPMEIEFDCKNCVMNLYALPNQ